MHELYHENSKLRLKLIVIKFNRLMGSKFLKIGVYDFNRVARQNCGAWKGWQGFDNTFLNQRSVNRLIL
jgi:hypothetical protein